jgi:protein-S-isoprenylcysteine O-methyltransferase Ste14
MLYDPIVAIQVLSSVYAFASLRPTEFIPPFICAILLMLSLLLFWWSIFTAKSLDFAFSSNVGKLILAGPYSIIRHPFYASYILTWLSTTLLFNSIFLWFTLVYLVTFYLSSARSEEKVILKTERSSEYLNYIQNVGMFLPRIWKWKN